MSFNDFMCHTRERYRANNPIAATKYTAADAFSGIQRRISPDLGRGESVWERDWDVLCILDACRVDLFNQVAPEYHWLPTEVDNIWSVGSASPEWIGHTFDPEHWKGEMAKTAYITSNPFSAKPGDRAAEAPDHALPLREEDFAQLEEVWKTHWEDDPVSTVRPRVLTDRTIDTWRRREHLGVKRVIVHYMQPHIPFRSRPEWFGKRHNLNIFGESQKESGKDPWKRVRDGEIDAEEFWEAYTDNLHWVLDDISLLRENCDADIVLSSDHGNAMGEWGLWSHPAGVGAPILRRVPWVAVEAQDTVEYEPTYTAKKTTVASKTVQNRLKSLGYHE